MLVEIKRKTYTPKATEGSLFINNVFECYTLEDMVREKPGVPVEQWKVPHRTAIPVGLYHLIIDYSPKFGRPMPHIIGVPGFDGIRIHWGNSDVDTDGCPLVGLDEHPENDDWIGRSKFAFDVFFAKLEAAINIGEQVMIRITNG